MVYDNVSLINCRNICRFLKSYHGYVYDYQQLGKTKQKHFKIMVKGD